MREVHPKVLHGQPCQPTIEKVSQPQEEKDDFYDELYRFIGKLKGKYVVLGDMNRHIGRNVDGFEGGNGLVIVTQKVKPFLNLIISSRMVGSTHWCVLY